MAGFTAIATGIGIAATAGTTIGSFAQAGEQARLKKEAEEAASKAMDEARKKLDVNYYEQLGIQKEPYELAARNILAQGALATQALTEGDERSLAAGVGRVQLAQQAGQEKVATAMQQEKAQLDKLVAGEDTRLRDIGIQLDTMEAQGAQQAASDAARAEAQAIQQGFAGLTSLGTQVASLAPLYAKTPEVRAADRLKRQAARQGIDLSTLDLSDTEALKEVGINLTDRQFGSLQAEGIKTFDQLKQFNKTGSFTKPKIGKSVDVIDAFSNVTGYTTGIPSEYIGMGVKAGLSQFLPKGQESLDLIGGLDPIRQRMAADKAPFVDGNEYENIIGNVRKGLESGTITAEILRSLGLEILIPSEYR
tara:strand:+ start:1162 stop:2253 length:1092 start_codon:yes stop_codon:yes gene_type:complete